MEEKAKVIKMDEKTTVYATKKAVHYNEGDAMKVHPELAKKLIKEGKATDKPKEVK